MKVFCIGGLMRVKQSTDYAFHDSLQRVWNYFEGCRTQRIGPTLRRQESSWALSAAGDDLMDCEMHYIHMYTHQLYVRHGRVCVTDQYIHISLQSQIYAQLAKNLIRDVLQTQKFLNYSQSFYLLQFCIFTTKAKVESPYMRVLDCSSLFGPDWSVCGSPPWEHCMGCADRVMQIIFPSHMPFKCHKSWL